MLGFDWKAWLGSDQAVIRVQGLEEIRERGLVEALPEVERLTDDDAPYAFDHGDRRMVAEVRADALETLQHLCRLAGRPPPDRAFLVRKAMPADEIGATASADPGKVPERDAELLGRYRALQLAGKVVYRSERIDPVSGLTPLQKEVIASQLRSPRPRPHLRVGAPWDPSFTLGFVYDEGGRRVLDFAGGPVGDAARERVEQALRRSLPLPYPTERVE